jgi:hypothetical protein
MEPRISVCIFVSPLIVFLFPDNEIMLNGHLVPPFNWF